MLSPRHWRIRRKKNKTNTKRKSVLQKINLSDIHREKSGSCRNIGGHPQHVSSSSTKKFIKKRPSLWELSTAEHKTTVHSEVIMRRKKEKEQELQTVELQEPICPNIVKPIDIGKVYNKYNNDNTSSFSSNSEYVNKKFSCEYKEKHKYDRDIDSDSSSVSSFIHLDRKNSESDDELETHPALRQASVLKKFMLEDMRSRIDKHTLQKEYSTSSIVYLKTEEGEISDALTNLLTLRVKQEKEKDLQISMWKLKTENFELVNWNDFINNHQHIVIDRSSKYTFIETSKLVTVY